MTAANRTLLTLGFGSAFKLAFRAGERMEPPERILPWGAHAAAFIGLPGKAVYDR